MITLFPKSLHFRQKNLNSHVQILRIEKPEIPEEVSNDNSFFDTSEISSEIEEEEIDENYDGIASEDKSQVSLLFRFISLEDGKERTAQ